MGVPSCTVLNYQAGIGSSLECRFESSDEKQQYVQDAKDEEEDWWNNLDSSAVAATPLVRDVGVDSLFEVENSCPAEVDAVVTRSQVRLTAGLVETGPVGGAAALAPVMRAAVARPKAKPSPQSWKKSAAETKAEDEELWKKVRVAEAASRLPATVTQQSTLNKRSCYTAQQLNSQKQNERRAKEKARLAEAEKRRRGFEEVQLPAPSAKKQKIATVSKPGRVLDTVAEFWERKKARLAESASSAAVGEPLAK